jgi:hypothetical protein
MSHLKCRLLKNQVPG